MPFERRRAAALASFFVAYFPTRTHSLASLLPFAPPSAGLFCPMTHVSAPASVDFRFFASSRRSRPFAGSRASSSTSLVLSSAR
jgi:hypothetical protein